MSYNLTSIADTNTTLGFVQNVNEVLLFGWLGTAILGVIFVVTFMAFISTSRQPVKSFVGASFIAFGMALLLSIVNLINPMAIWVTLTMTAFGAAFWKLD